jgi:hypothetical protein
MNPHDANILEGMQQMIGPMAYLQDRDVRVFHAASIGPDQILETVGKLVHYLPGVVIVLSLQPSVTRKLEVNEQNPILVIPWHAIRAIRGDLPLSIEDMRQLSHVPLEPEEAEPEESGN